MEIINLGATNSILNQFVAELRDVTIQTDSLRFRRNIERIGEILSYEISKQISYENKNVQTPLGRASLMVPCSQVVISTILRAGLPFHQGFLNYFDHAENAFVSAYRKYKDRLNFDIHIEYIASPRLNGKTLIITDPMLATGSSMELAFDLLEKAHIGITPGIDFGSQTEGFLRLSYANSIDNLAEAMRRLEAYIRQR